MDATTFGFLYSKINHLTDTIGETATQATEAWLEDNIDPSTGYVLDNTLTLDNAAPPASAVGDLKSALDEQSEKIDDFSDITGYYLDITDKFIFTNGKGVRFNTNGVLYDNSYASYSNFVDISEFKYLFFTIRHVTSSTSAGMALYNDTTDTEASFVSGTQEPYGGVDANSFCNYRRGVGNAKYIRVTWYPSSNALYGDFRCIGIKKGSYETTDNLAKANSKVTGVVEYWGEDLYIEPYLTSGQSETVLGIERRGEYVTLNKTDTSSSDIRVKLDKLFGRTLSASTFTGYAKEIPFISGHKYRFKTEYISGETNAGGGVALFIRDTSNTSVVSLVADEEKDYTWQDSNGTILMYVSKNVTYTNYKFRLSITDLTVSGNDSEITTVKSKYLEELDTTVSSVIEKSDEPCLIFPLVTDIHYISDISSYLFDDSINNIKAFAKNVNCNGLICLGDITDGGQNDTQPTTKSAAISLGNLLMGKMRSLGIPVYFSIGNHDDCRYMTTGMTAGEIYAYYMKQSEQDVHPDVNLLSRGTNYYKDFEGYNTRLICINTNILPTENDKGAYGLTNNTVSWLSDVLEDMPNDYIGMIITHVPLEDDLLWSGVATVTNAANACNVIANCGKTCFVITGHTHFDASKNGDFLSVVVASNKYTPKDENFAITTKGGQTAYQYKRVATDYTQDLWDVVVLRPRAKKLNFIRFGAGVDREFDLT